MEKTPLLPLPQGCVVGRFIRRYKRFSVEMLLDGQNVWSTATIPAACWA